jgi:hypothetical protein
MRSADSSTLSFLSVLPQKSGRHGSPRDQLPKTTGGRRRPWTRRPPSSQIVKERPATPFERSKSRGGVDLSVRDGALSVGRRVWWKHRHGVPARDGVLPGHRGVASFSRHVLSFGRGVLSFRRRVLPFGCDVWSSRRRVLPFWHRILPGGRREVPRERLVWACDGYSGGVREHAPLRDYSFLSGVTASAGGVCSTGGGIGSAGRFFPRKG